MKEFDEYTENLIGLELMVDRVQEHLDYELWKTRWALAGLSVLSLIQTGAIAWLILN